MPLVGRETLQLFPTPVGTFDVDDRELLAHAAEQILARAATTPTVPRGERTGWQSEADLLGWTPLLHRVGDLCSQALASVAQLGGDNIYLSAWANVLRRGDYFTPHTHSNSVWSLVLYVDAGDSSRDAGGALALRDPRAGAGLVHGPTNAHDTACTFTLFPRTGMLVVFPAWLVHWVVPYQGERPRISIALNAR
jgi:uncharacterized protein (TIGR02466 family)